MAPSWLLEQDIHGAGQCDVMNMIKVSIENLMDGSNRWMDGAYLHMDLIYIFTSVSKIVNTSVTGMRSELSMA